MAELPDVNWNSLELHRRTFTVLGWCSAVVTGVTSFYTFFEAMPLVALAILVGGSLVTALAWLIAALVPLIAYFATLAWYRACGGQESEPQDRDESSGVALGCSKPALPDDLSSIQELSPEQASAVVRQAFCSIELNGLKSLLPVVAQALAEHDGNRVTWLELNGLGDITPEAAVALGTGYRGDLSLNGVTSITADAANALATAPSSLSLGGLTELTPEAGDALSGCTCLKLNGLASLSTEAARALVRPRDRLELNSLTTISAEVAEILCGRFAFLSLNGLRTLTPQVAEILMRRTAELSLNGLTSLTEDLAAVLAKRGIRLELDGVTSLSPEIARKLSRKEPNVGWLLLNGLSSLTPDAAQALAEDARQGLSLLGLARLAGDVAAALAHFRGYLTVHVSDAFSHDAALALAAFRGQGIRLRHDKALSAETAAVLRTNDLIQCDYRGP